MLTSYQIETVGYIVNGDVVCPDDLIDVEGHVTRLDRYSAEESWGEEGLWCGECGKEIVAPPTPHERLEWGLDDLETHVQIIHGDPAGENADHDLYDHDHEEG